MPGRLVHFEIPAKDTQRARDFYSALFGWTFQTYEGPMQYHMTQAGGDPGGGLYESQQGESGVKVYFDVDDINAGAARVRELGGDCDEPGPVPNMGWYAQCRDPEGNEFSLWQTDESAPMPEQAGAQTASG
jgi:uncharacterized protein